ncbi:MAG: Lrp/AsnC family transcriptional regulator, partial [Planctomycetota bacterium]
MKVRLCDIEQKILDVLQHGLPMSQMPYKDMAQQIGIEVNELLAVLKGWKKQGRLRRVGAIVNHFKVGFGAGAMVVWQAGADHVVEIGQTFAGFEEVSHVYERQTSEN